MGRFPVGGVDDRRWHDNALASRVRNLIDGALDWLVENLDLFDPFKDNHTFDQYYAKPLLELSMTCMLYSRHKNLNQDPRIGQIALFISRVWDRPEYWQRLTRFPEMLLLYGMTSIALRRCGFGNHCYPELMQRVLKQGYASAVEVVPYRALDFRYMLDCGGCEHTFASYSDIYKNTLLSKTPSVAYLTDEDAYAITHTLFYISDFGARPPDVIPPEQLPAVQRLTTSLLGVYLRSCNWDLVAEILVSCRCLNWRPNCLFEAAWSGLLGAQLANGAVPGPYFSSDKMKRLSGMEQRIYFLKQNYHTTLVSVLAGFLTEEWDSNISPADSREQRGIVGMKSSKPIFEDLRSIGGRAHKWLLAVVERSAGQTQLPRLLELLIGCWICETGLGVDPTNSGCKKLASEICTRLDDHGETEQGAALLGCDGASVLLSVGILRRLDNKSGPMERFVRQVASVIVDQTGPNHTCTAELFTSCFLLSRLHLNPPPGSPHEISVSTIGRGSQLVNADAAEMRLLADEIAASTAYGRRRPANDPKLLVELCNVLQVWMHTYLRKYDPELGSSLLRTMNYLMPSEKDGYLEGVAFVIAQQQIEGCFGFLGPEIFRMRESKPNLNADIDIYLPITVSCLWTIAEATQDDFDLFSSI